MTKTKAKQDLIELVSKLSYELQRHCNNSSEFDDKSDFLDLVNANHDTNETYNNICNLQSAFNLPTPRDLRKLVRDYENQLKEYHRNDEIWERIYKFFTHLGFDKNNIETICTNMSSLYIENPKKYELKIIYYLQSNLIKK
ncbi:MAG: hypothetical protein J6S85_22740 [Methanobrevibacter sp.]|nr:hypothetical protein [Methanobrevibacter sp.]